MVYLSHLPTYLPIMFLIVGLLLIILAVVFQSRHFKLSIFFFIAGIGLLMLTAGSAEMLFN